MFVQYSIDAAQPLTGISQYEPGKARAQHLKPHPVITSG